MFIGEGVSIAQDANNTMVQNGDVDLGDLQKDIRQKNDKIMAQVPTFEDTMEHGAITAPRK